MLLAAPAGAGAADTFVDATRPDNTGDCLTPATACKTIAGPAAAVTKTGADDTIFVADPAVPTTYPQSIVLEDARSLVSLSADPAENIIDNGTGGGTTAAIEVSAVGGAGTSTVEGFTIRSDFQAVEVNSPVLLRENVFDEPGPISNVQSANVALNLSTGKATVENNSFVDPAPVMTQNQTGIVGFGAGAPLISSNTFEDLTSAVRVANGAATIADNTITGTRGGANAGAAISATSGEPKIARNHVSEPFFYAPSDFIFGISLNSIGPITGTLKRNRVFDHVFGVNVEGEDVSVQMDSDLIAQSTLIGLEVSGDAPDANVELFARNLTVVDTNDPNSMFEDDVRVGDAAIELDSSIVGDLGINDLGGASCELSFSRGPTTTGTTCQSFQTSADPLFDDAPGGDYRLQPTSPLIDKGDPAKPPKGARDVDGLRRALDGSGNCVGKGRRDIGAHEFECSPPNTRITGGPKGTTSDKTPTFRFRGSGSEDDFVCRLDDKPFKPCDSPKAYGHQSIGKHTFRVRAVDPDTAVSDPTPAKRGFKIT